MGGLPGYGGALPGGYGGCRGLANELAGVGVGGNDDENEDLLGTGESLLEQASGSTMVDKESALEHSISENSAPLEIPRAKGVRDGVWTKRDAEVVEQALDAPPKLKKDATYLLGLSEEAVADAIMAAMPDANLPAYRAKQVHKALYAQHVRDVRDITTLSKQLRQDMHEAGIRIGRSPVHKTVVAADGTTKFLVRLHDDRLVETVGIPALNKSEKERLTVCVSSQVGCPLRCTFCATGKGGFARNLATHEIVDQLLTVEEHFGQRVTNVVFMGMGEPLLNLRNVLPALRSMNKDVGIGARHLTLSTVGVPNTLKRLAERNLQSTLAVSLHAPNQKLREQLVPSAKAYPIEALLDDCAKYFAVTRRRVSFEYALLGGVNDQMEHADELVSTLRKHGHGGAHVNLIPWNSVEGAEFRRPSAAAVRSFKHRLETANVQCTIRISRGLDAAAACGQLRNANQKIPLTT